MKHNRVYKSKIRLAILALFVPGLILSSLIKNFTTLNILKAETESGSVQIWEPAWNRRYFRVALREIRSARKEILVFVYQIRFYRNYPDSSTNILLKELVRASARGVAVKVLTDISNWNAKGSYDNLLACKYLSERGVEVYVDNPRVTTHAKVMVIDGKEVLLGSTNWTYYALEKNNEVSILIRDPLLASEMRKYFYRIIWRKYSDELLKIYQRAK